MQSSIDPTTINVNFPIADENQPSQGFRDNFSYIKNNFVDAYNDITNLQTTYIQVVGDVTTNASNNQALGQADGVITLDISLSNDGSNGSGGSYDSRTQGISFDYTSSGLIKKVVTYANGNLTAYDTSTNVTITNTPEDSTYTGYTGVSSFTIPTFKTDTFGRVVSVNSTTVNNNGLLGFKMPPVSVLIGNTASLSSAVTLQNDGEVIVRRSGNITSGTLNLSDLGDTNVSSVSNGQFLVYQNSKWTPVTYSGGTVTSIGVGPGLTITNPTTSPVINFQYSNLPALTAITGSELLAVDSSTTYKSITIQNISDYIKTTLSSSADLSQLPISTDKQLANINLAVYNSNLKSSYILPASQIYGYTSGKIIFVSPSGNDTSGDGSIINPYASVSKSLSMATSQTGYIISLMPGTYHENIGITQNNITLVSYQPQSVILAGTITYTPTAGQMLYVKNITISVSATNMILQGTAGNIVFEDCIFKNSGTGQTINTSGTITKLSITNSSIQGSCTFAHTGETTISNINSNDENIPTFILTSGTLNLSGIDVVNGIVHNGGSMYIKNIIGFKDDSSYMSSSSNSSSDIISVIDTSLKIVSSTGTDDYCSFSKVGSCGYYFENFDIDINSSQISGNAISYANNAWSYDFITTISNSDSTLTLNPYSKTSIITTTTNCAITMPIPTLKTANYILSMTVIVISNGANSITFDNVTWDQNLTPTLNYTSGKRNVFTFIYIPGDTVWLGGRAIYEA